MRKNNIFLLAFIIFILITFIPMIEHIPHVDECHAWCRANEMNISNFASILVMEGHAIIWYLLIMPFAKNNIAYPYSMLLINYLFVLASIFVLWKKSPFDNTIKGIITFSFFIISYLAIVARCYSIGVFGLFLLAFLNKDSLKHPLLYSTILGLTANTSAMATIGVSAFCFIFLFDLCKNIKNMKIKDVILSAVILLLFFSFLLYPFYNSILSFTYRGNNCHSLQEIKDTFIPFFCCSMYFLAAYLYLIFFILSKDGIKLNRSKFYLIYTNIALFLFLIFVHKGEIYHQFMFFVFLIVSLWISEIEFNKKSLNVIFYISLAIILFTNFNMDFCKGSATYKKLGEEIASDKEYSNSIFLLTTMDIRYELMPYIYVQNNADRFDYWEGEFRKNMNMIDNFYVDNDTKNAIYDFASKTNKKVFLLNNVEDMIAKDVDLPSPIEKYGVKIYRIK